MSHIDDDNNDAYRGPPYIGPGGVSYNRDETIAAVRDYYDFLVYMYLDPSYVTIPPEEGWPSITSDSLSGLGKTEEVIDLLKHLPYITLPSDDSLIVQGAPHAIFADWRRKAELVAFHGDAGYYRSVTEGERRTEHVPPSVVGLTSGGRNNRVLLLDTEHGVVYWPDCPPDTAGEDGYGIPGERFEPTQERLSDDPYDWCETEWEAMWREEGSAWPVKDFFEMLKDQFRQLRFIPMIEHGAVRDAYTTYVGDDGVIEMVSDIYRAHGWPDPERYRKDACLQAIEAALRERRRAEMHEGDDE